MSIDTVIFLGAGASAADGAPLQSNLFRDYFLGMDPLGQAHHDELATLFNDLYGINVERVDTTTLFPSFEELLGLLELSISRSESLKGYPITPTRPRTQNVREYLILLIAHILKSKLSSPGGTHHKVLVDRLKRNGTLRKTAFISLNYDILIDNALMESYPYADLDYGINFTNFSRNNDWHKPKSKKEVNLFKPHGSLNWLYCQTCVSLTLTPKEKSASTYLEEPRPCTECQSLMVPIIVPPSFMKIMNNYYLTQIWKKAESALQSARDLYFCGYSFPDADLHIKYMLKRIELKNGSTPRVYVVNWHSDKDQHQCIDEKLRYKRFFKDKDRVLYLRQSFSAFAQNGRNDEEWFPS